MCTGLFAGEVDQRWDLGIGVDIDEPRPELIALSDLDQPGIVLSARKARLQKLLEQHRDLHAVPSALAVQLQRMFAFRQVPFERSSRGRAVNGFEDAALSLEIPPHLRRNVLV